MHYYAPWVDPRVKLVRAKHLIAYLRKQAWNEEGVVRKHLLCFRHPTKRSAIFLPTLEDSDDNGLLIFEAVTELARIENRYAGDVLTELLSQSPAEQDGKSAATVVPGANDAIAHPVIR